MEENYLLEMLDIEKQFPGVKALDHAKLQLRPGSIHALMGENGAGKSTLMKCLFGIYKKDAGSIRMNGKEINFTSPRNALDHGVAMVHQELNQVLYRSVMENMWLGRFPLKAGLVDHKKMYNDTKSVLDDLEIKVDPKTIIGTMAVSQRQMLEIAKAVSYNAKIIVLDEPTSSLTSEEVEHLFRIMRRLCDQGVGIIYISHKMDEIKRISDEVTIMRDGQWISTDKTENLSTDDIIKRMVSLEFNRMIDYYKDADEIETIDDKPSRKDKEGKRSRKAEEGFARLFINFGKKDGLFVNDLIDIVHRCVKGKVRIGRIDLMEKFSFFEVEEAEARRVVKRMNGFELDGRRISVEFAQEKTEEDEKSSKGKGRKRRSTAQNRFMRESKKRTDKKKRR